MPFTAPNSILGNLCCPRSSPATQGALSHYLGIFGIHYLGIFGSPSFHIGFHACVKGHL
ncbi:hypothetical protein BDR04DRAFT_1188150 [Suillus decipiens]|nr:hypothetical protein BDR04DRAFT_1188150 [Suillus decipiens]